MRALVFLAFVALSAAAHAKETDCPANKAVYVREDGEKFVVRRYGEIRAKGRFGYDVQEGTFQGRRVLNYLVLPPSGTGMHFSDFANDPGVRDLLRSVRWKRSTEQNTWGMNPTGSGDGPLKGFWKFAECQDTAASAGTALLKNNPSGK